MTTRVVTAGEDAKRGIKGKDGKEAKEGEKGEGKGAKKKETKPHYEWLDVVHDEV